MNNLKKLCFSLAVVILATVVITGCGKNKEITYANLKGEWYSETCGTTIIFTSDSTLTMLNDGIEGEDYYRYKLDVECKIYFFYNEFSSVHNIEFVRNKRIMIDGMGIILGFDKGEHIFKRINS